MRGRFLLPVVALFVALSGITAHAQAPISGADQFGVAAIPSKRSTTNSATTSIDGFLSDAVPSAVTNGYGPLEFDTSNGEDRTDDGRTIILNGAPYLKGLGAHAASQVRYVLSADCPRVLKAWVGVDDEAGSRGSVAFRVFANATKVYDSGVMTGASATRHVDVSIGRATELQLVVTNGGDDNKYDHADWANAGVECAGTQSRIGRDLIAQSSLPNSLSFLSIVAIVGAFVLAGVALRRRERQVK
jgi:NPCBM/NEW2 domain